MRIGKQHAWRGIRNRMLLFFGGGAALILILISLVSQYGIPFTGFQGAYQIHQEEVLQHLSAIADIKKGEIRHWFEERLGDVRVAAKDPDLDRKVKALLERRRERRTLGLRAKALASAVRVTAEYAALRAMLWDATRMSREYEGVDVVELETGTIVASTREERVGADVSNDEEIRNAKLAGVEEQICFRHVPGAGDHMHVVHPVGAGDGRPSAVLVFLISPREVLAQLNSSGGLGSSGEIILVDMDRFILAPLKYPLPDGREATPLAYRLMTKPAELAAWGIEGLLFSRDYRGVPVIAVVRHLRLTSEFGLGMIVKVDEQEVLSFNRKALSYHLGVSAVGLALIIGAIYYLSGRLSRPIVELSRTARAVMDGDLDARSAVATDDEVEDLAHSFNSMVGTIQGWQGDLERKVKERTEQLVKSEEQLRQAQKMEAVGLLAGGVAHDFNNILSAIVGFGHLALMKTREGDPLRHYIEMILESSQRAAALTQSLLAFGRKQVMNVALMDLNERVKRFEKMLLRIVREDIELRTVCSAEALPVMADSGQIEQIIMNLVTNARDAMPRGGRLTIETRRIAVDDEFVRAHGCGTPGGYAVLSVADTGTGMDQQTKERIFEPFFTTKEQGRGTGLGLSMVYGIVKKHEGFITVYSEPEKGTVFSVYLPLEQTAVAPEGKSEETPEDIPHGSETVLIAEDDDVLREFLKKALEQFGYRVIEAVNGQDAVKQFAENRDAVQLVILDGIMPKMNGNEAYDEIRKFRPDVKAIFMSGYAEHVFPEAGVAEQRPELLAKPLSPRQLLRKVRGVLDGRRCGQC